MIQIQKLVAYAGMAAALAVLLSSTAKIGSAILTQSAPVDGFDVHLDDNGEDLVDLDEEPLLPIHRRLQAAQKGESGPGAVRDVLPALANMASRVRKLDESKLPYKCGAVLYDQQIPGEGGDLLNEWIQELVKANGGGSFISSGEQESKDAFVKEAEKQLQKIGPKDWKIIYTHKNGLAFDADENILRSWRGIVEKRNCHFVAASVFADPLDHSIKHTKKQFNECQCSMEEFKGKILDAVGAGNPWDKVKRGVKLLKTNFDLVLVDGEKDFSGEILRITGWKARSPVKKANMSDGELVYSKKLVSAVGKMSAANGDEHFIDALMHIYHNSLGYLMTQ